MASWTQRVVGAAKLNAATYEEIEADRGANGGAVAVVVLSSIAPAVGVLDLGGIAVAIPVAIVGLVAWLAWGFITWLLGTKLLPTPATQADLGQMLRTTGFSAGPGILRALGGVPGIGGIVMFVTPFWMLASMVVAVRQALDYTSTGRAFFVCFLGFLIYAGILVGTAVALGIGAAMLGMLMGAGPES